VNLVSGTLISLEFSEPARRPTYVGIANTTVGAANVVAPLLGGWIAGYGFAQLFGAGTLVGIVALVLLVVTVADPRRAVKPVVQIAEPI
jgi:MFS family permease